MSSSSKLVTKSQTERKGFTNWTDVVGGAGGGGRGDVKRVIGPRLQVFRNIFQR